MASEDIVKVPSELSSSEASAEVSSEQSSAPTVPPIRSILKKTTSGSTTSETDIPSSRKRGKSITFNEDVVTYWGSLKPTRKAANGGASSVSPQEDMEVDSQGHTSRRSSRLKMMTQLRSGLKTKVGGVLHKLGRSQNFEDVPEGEGGGAGVGGGKEEGGKDSSGLGPGLATPEDIKKGPRMKRRASDSGTPLELFEKSHSLPRSTSLTSSAEIFTHHNRSLRSKFARFGQRFKLDSRGSGDGEPVLTKVTPLGGLRGGWDSGCG